MTLRPWPQGEKYPGFFARPEKQAWLARNLQAWAHLRTTPPPDTTVGPVRVLHNKCPRC